MLRVCAAAIVVASASFAFGSQIESFTEPYRKIDIGPAEPGTLAIIPVQEGDRVAKGQIVAELENEMLQVSLEIAAATMDAHGRLESAVAERDLRRARLIKLNELREREHASQEEVERAATDLAIAEANVLAAQEQQIIARLEHKKTAAMIERRIMRSPIDAVVTRIYHEEREFVAASAPTVLTLVQLDPLRVVFSVPTPEAVMMKVGQKVPLSFLETGQSAVGRVELVAPVTEAESGTVRVKVLLDNPRGAYRCGARCALDLPDGPVTFNVPKR